LKRGSAFGCWFAPHAASRRPRPVSAGDTAGADRHCCINLRLPTYGGLYAWDFEKDGRELKVRVEGQLVFNSIFPVFDAAVAGFGLAYVPEDLPKPLLVKGRLKRVLHDWCPAYTGYHLYYPSRRQSSPVFSRLVDAPLPGISTPTFPITLTGACRTPP
jgi:DNA-binding transcriptional LysR family regulator